jgi:ribosomal protein L29
MKASELNKKSKAELERLLFEKKEELRNLNFGIKLRHSKNVRDIRKLKKLIARLNTIIKQKENINQ